MIKLDKWKKAQEYERKWHLNQIFNTYCEETKQFVYMSKMGFDKFKYTDYGIVGWDLGDISIFDVGGGDTSVLLKCKAKKRVVIDPCKFPKWIKMRYEDAGIIYYKQMGEKIKSRTKYDIGIIYNCLQHTQDPELIIKNMKKYCKEIRIFEWVDTVSTEGHPQILTEANLNKWLGGIGKVEELKENGCFGLSYYGIFPTGL